MTLRSLAAFLAMAFFLGLGDNSPARAQAKDDAPASPTAGKSDEPQSKPNNAKDKDKGKDQDKSQDPTKPAEGAGDKPVKLERATFGGGCFWCLEAVYERIPGVKTAVSGYAGGSVPRPTYEMVSSGLTGHAEVVQLVYDPEVVSFEKLLQVFWACHDPTTLNRQGPDFGTQYRSIILYHNEDQKKAALKSYKELTAAGAFADPIVTELEPLRAFYPAEKYHQDYFRRNRNAAYCQSEIVPKLRKLKLIK